MKLTATGKPFGEGNSTYLEGQTDWIWEAIKKDIMKSDAWERAKEVIAEGKEMHLDGVLKNLMTDILSDAFPEEMPKADVKKYLDELWDKLNESD